MDVDANTSRPRSHGALENDYAQAGPSSQAIPPPIFQQPPPESTHRRPLLDCTEDLISRFQLLPAYDRYVRPYIHTQPSVEVHPKPAPGAVSTHGALFSASTPGSFDKGKGREVLVGTPQTPGAAPTPAADGGDGGDGEEEEGAKGEKKRKTNYRHLIKDIPGKHSTKKDDYLQTLMLAPPKQKSSITRFDQRTQREAFTVSLEGIKGWNVSFLVAESPQAKEDRKKRKEAKKLAKAQVVAAGVPPTSSLSTLPSNITGLTPGTNIISASSSSGPLSALTPGVPSTGRIPPTPSSLPIGTPRPAPPIQRASSRPPGPGPGSGVGANVVTPASGPSHTARPGTPSLAAAAATTPRPRPSTPSIPNGGNIAVATALKRGTKREYEDDIPLAQVVANAQKRAVTGTIGQQGNLKNVVGPPRPMKKQRTDSSTHTGMGIPALKREVPQQQPTPQGV